MFSRALLSALVLIIPAPALAQSAAECPTSECSTASAGVSPAPSQSRLWQDAAATHQLKIAFVDALQRFLRAQAGTFGDEGAELRASLDAMRTSLSKWDQAIQQFESQAIRAGRDAEASIALATVRLDRFRIEPALRALDAAEQIDDSRPDLYALRALAAGAAKRPDDAVRALRRATGLDARDPTLSYALMRRLTQLGRLDDAAQVQRALPRMLAAPRQVTFARVDLLSQAAGTAPIFPQARYAPGFAALDAGDYEKALAAFTDAVERDPLVLRPAEARAAVVAAAGVLKSGRADVALRQLQATVAAFPDDPEVHRLLGMAYWITEQSGNSIEHLRMAIRLAPADERARLLLSDVLASERRLSEAERELMLASEAGLQSGLISYRLAQLFQRQSLLPRAAKAFEESERFGPVVGRDAFYLAWASVLVNQADFDGAVAVYSKRIDVNANSGDAHRQLGEIHFLQGGDDEGLVEFLLAAWLDPKDAKAHAAAGQVYARQLKLSDAISALQRALAIDGSLREARYALGTALMRSGKTVEARRELDLFARQQAEAEAAGQREFQLDALRRQAAKDALAGNHEQAIARYREAAQLDPSGRTQRDLGLLLVRVKKLAEAIEPLAAAQKIEETAEGFAALVTVYATLGKDEDAERARADYREFLSRERMRRLRELAGR